ncbi:hypothetical protein [Cellulosimicrobium sp. Marseille-Q8652]
MFGDPDEPDHREALAIVDRTEHAVADVLRHGGHVGEADAATLAHVVSAVVFLAMVTRADAGVGRRLERPGSS